MSFEVNSALIYTTLYSITGIFIDTGIPRF